MSKDQADILATPSCDTAVAKTCVKQIVGARGLSVSDYMEVLRKDQRKKDQLAEERQRKIKEKEHKMKEMEEKKKLKQMGRGNGRGVIGDVERELEVTKEMQSFKNEPTTHPILT